MNNEDLTKNVKENYLTQKEKENNKLQSKVYHRDKN